ncbi:hypothetical protein [Streptomyces parvus]
MEHHTSFIGRPPNSPSSTAQKPSLKMSLPGTVNYLDLVPEERG